MKRFGVEKDREFEIGGEVFSWVYPYWEDAADSFDSANTAENGEDPKMRDSIGDLIERIQLFLEPDQVERWVALTKRRKNPVPYSQFPELYRWLVEVTSNPTPTEPSSPSEDGPRKTAATSTAG